eukprot:TRINITY_DN34475_c0_g1_i1.p3 TRINITY_DN34475_c0_g1~~TRINITY_DN34475_c0_g1_i1.p3  ORF type:complete len:115 (-),score=3.41 TRINITY_DN34475_c0_g1_i1:141-485(-)
MFQIFLKYALSLCSLEQVMGCKLGQKCHAEKIKKGDRTSVSLQTADIRGASPMKIIRPAIHVQSRSIEEKEKSYAVGFGYSNFGRCPRQQVSKYRFQRSARKTTLQKPVDMMAE